MGAYKYIGELYKKKQSDVYVMKWTVPRMAIMCTPLCGRSAVYAVINHTGHQYKIYAIATIWGFFGGLAGRSKGGPCE